MNLRVCTSALRVCTHVEDGGQLKPCTLFWNSAPLRDPGFTDEAKWAGQQVPGTFQLHFPSAGITDSTTMPGFSM